MLCVYGGGGGAVATSQAAGYSSLLLKGRMSLF